LFAKVHVTGVSASCPEDLSSNASSDEEDIMEITANDKPKDSTFSNAHDKMKEDRFWPHFKGAIGAIDGLHVEVVMPIDEVINYTCRHGYTSQNVLAICDFNMRFTFVVAG
jgi:hypothetical protein